MSSKYDVIIIGAGMGGLSVANFLVKYGKRVLIIEKHDKPGGYLTSFTRQGYTFDSAVFHLNELGANESISKFYDFWGKKIAAEKIQYNMNIFCGDNNYQINSTNLPEDLIKHFPEEEKAIKDFFYLSDKMFSEMMSSGAPKAPYEMSLFEKLSFGISSLFKRPTLLKFMKKRSDQYLLKKFRSQDLATLLMSYYPINDLVLFSQVYGWMMMKKNANYYPKNGMQSLPDTAVAIFEENGGTVLLNTEVEEIIIENGRAKGVRCIHGLAFYSEIIIANSPIHHTLSKLLPELPILESFRKKVFSREIFTSVMLIFVGIQEEYSFNGSNFISIMDKDSLILTKDKVNATNCPIITIVLPKPMNQQNNSLLIGAFLPYSYHNYWNTDGTMIRNKDYRKCKEKVTDEIIDRIASKLGEEFREAIDYVLPATPLTLERYTYNKEGSIMGWNLDPKNYGKFIPQTTPIENLYFVGQWVFPGGGVPGVVASGYYLAKTILAKEGINLEEEFKKHFQNQ